MKIVQHAPDLIVTIVIAVLMERRSTAQAHRRILSTVLIAAQPDLMKSMMVLAFVMKIVLHALGLITTTAIAVRVERKKTALVF